MCTQATKKVKHLLYHFQPNDNNDCDNDNEGNYNNGLKLTKKRYTEKH